MADEKDQQEQSNSIDQPEKPALASPVPQYQSPDWNVVAPAIALLKELLSRAERLRQQDAHYQETSQAIEHSQMSAQEQLPILEPIYVSLDGDDIGNKVALAEEKNDEQTLQEVSNKINAGQNLMIEWARQMGGKVIEAGGDEGLIKVPQTAMNHIEDLRSQYKNLVGATATIGVGSTIRESTQARMLGKLKGKDQTVVYHENVPVELRHRLQASGDRSEADKLKEAGLGQA